MILRTKENLNKIGYNVGVLLKKQEEISLGVPSLPLKLTKPNLAI